MADKPYNFSKETIKRSNDFGTANRAAALIRKILMPYSKNTWDKTFVKRLRNKAIAIVNTDNPGLKGQLQFTDGDTSLLERFEFNSARELSNLIHFRTEVELKNADSLIISIPKIEPENSFKRPHYAKSLLIRYTCSIIHFDLEKGGSTSIDDLEIFVGKPFAGAKAEIPLQSAETSVIIVSMCAWCMNGTRIDNPKWYAGRIIKTYNLLDGQPRPFKYKDETIKIHRRPKIEPDRKKGNLGWVMG